MPIYEKTIAATEGSKGYINAPTGAGALAFAAADHVKVRRLTQAEIIKLAMAGTKIDQAPG